MAEKKKKATAQSEVENATEPTAENTQTNETEGASELVALQAQVETLQAELAAANDKYLRMIAEYDNFRKRSAHDRELACAEATSNLARFDGIKYGVRAKGDDYIDIYYKSRTAGFGDEVKRRIMIGNYVLSSGYYDAYYLKASKIRTLFKSQLEGVLSSCDAIIGPTAPTTAPALNHYETDKTKEYYSDLYTVIANITGNPAISIPCGVGKDGLPIGIQLIGRFYDERTLFSIAEGYEREVK
jgi:Asp-tRNA(Asn)/Glu-tRNA(Gln) amidotransferase A subunit family amidase